MEPQVAAALIGGLSGLATGAIGSLLAPWAQWGVDKRRGRAQNRRDRIDQWRQGYAELAASDGGALNGRLFLTAPWYLTLRPHLLPAEREKIEDLTTIAIDISGPNVYGSTIQSEIDRLAKEWDVE